MEALDASPGGAVASTDLGGSSKQKSDILFDRRG